MRRRLDLLTLRAHLLEAPITFPVIAISYKGCMGRRDTECAEPARTVITGAAAPLSVEDLKLALAGYNITSPHAKFPDLCETAAAGPALLAGAGVRIRRDVAMGLL
jgi:hypothetical protein